MRNALATVEGGARSGNLTGFFLSDRLIIQRSVGEARDSGSVITWSR